MEQIIYFVIGLVALSVVWILFPRNKTVSKHNSSQSRPGKARLKVIVIECEKCGKKLDTICMDTPTKPAASKLSKITATGSMMKVRRKIEPCPHCLMVQKDKGRMNGFMKCLKKGPGFIG